MTQWLHCNNCGIANSTDKSDEYYCGSCGHVLCGTCTSRLQLCPLDKRPFNAIQINYSMPQKLRVYFEDPDILLKSWRKCIRFQFEQRIQCEPQGYIDNFKQIRKLKEQIKLLVKTKDALVENTERDEKRNREMKVYLKHCTHNRIRSNRSFAASRESTSTSMNFSRTLGESGVDMQSDFSVGDGLG